MRKTFLIILIALFMLLSCKNPEEIILPDKYLSIQNKMIMYKEKPYTGKINLPESEKGNEGYMNIKAGYLDGTSEIKNTKDGFLLRYNVRGRKFDGEFIYKNKDGEMYLLIDKGTITAMKLINNLEKTAYDFTFKDGLANGTFEDHDKKLFFKDGMAEIENENNIDIKTKFSIDQSTWKITMEDFVENESYSKYEKLLGLNLEVIENILFSTIKTD